MDLCFHYFNLLQPTYADVNTTYYFLFYFFIVLLRVGLYTIFIAGIIASFPDNLGPPNPQRIKDLLCS